MNLTDVEAFALRTIFRDGGSLASEVRDQIDTADVVRREFTGVGFFTAIRLARPIQSIPKLRMHEFNFCHPAFPYGGSFMCTIDAPDLLEIEAVTLGGASWPDSLDTSMFTELI